MDAKEYRTELNKKLNETISAFIKENGLSCDKCSYKINGKCKSKVYCIVGQNVGLYVNYEKKE